MALQADQGLMAVQAEVLLTLRLVALQAVGEGLEPCGHHPQLRSKAASNPKVDNASVGL